jgi:hypothetical protein
MSLESWFTLAEPPAIHAQALAEAPAQASVAAEPGPMAEILLTMAEAYEDAMGAGRGPVAAMQDALLALRWSDLRDLSGQGARRASAKAERRLRAMLDRLILDGDAWSTEARREVA